MAQLVAHWLSIVRDCRFNSCSPEFCWCLFDKKDVVVAITTPSAQAAFNNLKDMPIVFSGVTDPESAGLIRKNITGVSDMTPIRKQL